MMTRKSLSAGPFMSGDVSLSERHALANSGSFRNRVQIAMTNEANDVLNEDPSSLPGGWAEYQRREQLARRTVENSWPVTIEACYSLVTHDGIHSANPDDYTDIQIQVVVNNQWSTMAGWNPNATAPAMGTVSGRVYHDANGNGEQDIGEAGIEGVKVNLTDEHNHTIVAITDVNGDWAASVRVGSVDFAIDNGTLPPGAVLTDGPDSATVNLNEGQNIHGTTGYQF